MGKAKTFKHVLMHSLLPSVEYYTKIKKTPLLFSIKFAIMLLIVVSTLLYSASALRLIISSDQSDLRTQLKYAVENMPDDMIIIIKNNRLVTNNDRPLIIYTDSSVRPNPLIVVDEYAQPEKITQYNSSILFTKTGFAVYTNNEMKFYRYKLSKTVIVNKESATKLINTITTAAPILLIAGSVLVIPIITIISIIIKIITLMIMSFIVFIPAHLSSHNVTYRKTFQVSLHAMSLPLLVELLINAIGVKSYPGFLFSFITLIFVAGGVYEAYFGAPIRIKNPSK